MSTPAFEVRTFRALPAAAVAVLVLEGRFEAATPVELGRPRLLVEAEGRRHELAAIVGAVAIAGPGGVPWRAAFAVPLATVAGDRYSLVVGRDLVVELPAPDVDDDRGDEDGARLARLARELNAARRRIDTAAERLARAEQDRDDARAELGETRTELHETRGELHGMRAELHETRAQLDGLREELQRARTELDDARAELKAARAAGPPAARRRPPADGEAQTEPVELSTARTEPVRPTTRVMPRPAGSPPQRPVRRTSAGPQRAFALFSLAIAIAAFVLVVVFGVSPR